MRFWCKITRSTSSGEILLDAGNCANNKMTILYHGTNKEYLEKVIEDRGCYTHKLRSIELLKDLVRSSQAMGFKGINILKGLSRAYENYDWIGGNLFFAEEPRVAALFAKRKGYTPVVLKVDTEKLREKNGKMKTYAMGYGTEYQLIRGKLDPSQYELINLEDNGIAEEIARGKLTLDDFLESQKEFPLTGVA